MYKFDLKPNGSYLKYPIQGYYHEQYHAGNSHRRNSTGTVENIITTLKNSFGSTNETNLISAKGRLVEILKKDLNLVHKISGKERLIVCVIPRSKKESFYNSNQLYFKKGVKQAIAQFNALIDGAEFIKRKTHTRTTHLDRSGNGGAGRLPYPGITKETCSISNEVIGKDILLIDDLYTKTVNIDEDAIQALLDHGANSVIFYSLGKTFNSEYSQEENDEKVDIDNFNVFKLSIGLAQTYSLIKMNKSIDQIAFKRGFTRGTIIKHIVDISKVLGAESVANYKPSNDLLNKVRIAVNNIGSTERLKPIFEELNENISYDDIRLSLIFL